MRKFLIAGYGNQLRGDDGIGPAIAEQLSTDIDNPAVEIHSLHQLQPEIAALLATTAECAIFIDATTGDTPGTVACSIVQPENQRSGAFTHTLTPGTLVYMAAHLYNHVPETWLITITGHSFELTENLSPQVQATIPEVIRLVKKLLSPDRDRANGSTLPEAHPDCSYLSE